MHANDTPSGFPDFGAMRKALRESERSSASDDELDCPNPSCEGTIRAHDGLLACGECLLGRAKGR
ncbi:hypothetical protein BRC94_00070 [Halobacteriales archaeon QS_5_70_17]|nr:MAG: hypothetical protein BRC94_00070 [Halobacteriales archaeon QS_5_70_17]